MIYSKSQSLKTQTNKLSSLVIGFFGVIAAAIIGTAGVVAADPPSGVNSSSTPSVVEFCKMHYKELGFKNVGQCVSHLNGHGHGYGGGNGNDNDNDQGNQNGNSSNHHHSHNFFADWWHHMEHVF